MRKFYILAVASAAVMAFAACSSDDLASIDPTTPSTSTDENVPVNFGTYLGDAQSTRAYTGGGIYTTEELANADGFGIFAINTETEIFKPDNAKDHTLNGDYNYMFNQQVTGKTSEGTTTWSTDPVKYWPNKTLTATTTGEGQNAKTIVEEKPQHVTFFAYAPYCKLADLSDDKFNWWESAAIYNGGTDNFNGGILAMSTSEYFNQDIADADKNNWFSKADPVIALDLTKASNQTDLLWGTTGSNGVSEDGAAQNGRKLNNNLGTDADGADGGAYAVNADLTKMKTDGKVSFTFRHTLARFGGHKANDVNDNTITIDAVADAESNSSTKQLEGNTRISLKWLAIEVLGANKEDNTDVVYPTKGFFNLATGLWGQMAFDPAGNHVNEEVKYLAENNPVYVLYPNGVNNVGTYLADVMPFLNNKTITSYRSIPLNSSLTVNGDGGDSYEDFITTSPEETDDYGNPIPATSTWKEITTEEQGGSEGESTTKKVDNSGVTTTTQSVYVTDKDADPLLIIPNSTIKPKLRVIASYDIVTPDPAYINTNGHKGYTKVHQVVGKDITFANVAEMNKKYNLHIHLGVTSIKVDATVNDWETATKKEGENVVEDSKDVDLPKNVEPEK